MRSPRSSSAACRPARALQRLPDVALAVLLDLLFVDGEDRQAAPRPRLPGDDHVGWRLLSRRQRRGQEEGRERAFHFVVASIVARPVTDAQPEKPSASSQTSLCDSSTT